MVSVFLGLVQPLQPALVRDDGEGLQLSGKAHTLYTEDLGSVFSIPTERIWQQVMGEP